MHRLSHFFCGSAALVISACAPTKLPPAETLQRSALASLEDPNRSPASINGLSSDKPTMKALDKRPIEVPHHSIIGFALASCSARNGRATPPPTAGKVDLSRYAGRWHEIARLPAPFQKDNEQAIAEYGKNADGTLSVHNIAVRADGTQHGIKGYAKVLNPPQNTKLAVRFNTWFGPLIPVPKEGNYWILHVDESYQEAIVGTPDRRFLWLLARTPQLSAPRKAALVARAETLGFDVTRLVTTQRQ